MTLRVPPLPPVPDGTAAAVRAAFPPGHLDVDLRAECGTLDDDPLVAALDAPEGRPVEGAPWRLALVLVRPDIAGRTDRQAAAAVRRGLAWPSAVSLDWTDPGCDCPLVHEFRDRLLTHAAAPRLLDPFVSACKARGGLKARGTPRTDATHVLAAVRPLHRVEGVLDARPQALNQLREADPAWVQPHVPLDW